jgi:hypothetical protein
MPCHATQQIHYFQPKHETGVVTLVPRNENELTFVHFQVTYYAMGIGKISLHM